MTQTNPNCRVLLKMEESRRRHLCNTRFCQKKNKKKNSIEDITELFKSDASVTLPDLYNSILALKTSLFLIERNLLTIYIDKLECTLDKPLQLLEFQIPTLGPYLRFNQPYPVLETALQPETTLFHLTILSKPY